MQPELQFKRGSESDETLPVGSRTVRLEFRRNPRAHRYILRAVGDGLARVTIPRGGSRAFARQFVAGHSRWLQRQFESLCRHQGTTGAWLHGTRFLFRGEWVCLNLDPGKSVIRFSDQEVPFSCQAENLRPAVEQHLKRLAASELPKRCQELAAAQGVSVSRVTVRDQRTRWGSCSAKGTISMNWRLVQVPATVRDYLILHELMHRREMNHSGRFWRLVELVCPGFREAESWLKENKTLVRE